MKCRCGFEIHIPKFCPECGSPIEIPSTEKDSNSNSSNCMGVNDLLTVQEVAQILNVSDETVYRMVRENQIPYSKIRRQIRFLSWEINNWLESNKSKP